MAKKSTAKKQATIKKKSSPRTKVSVSQAPGFSVWQLTTLSLLSLVASYVFASLAIDSGSLWHYAFCVASAYLFVRFSAQAFTSFFIRK